MVPVMILSSSVLKFISLVRSAVWVVPRDVTRKLSESAAKSGRTSGSP
jgi:hypothetical protein